MQERRASQTKKQEAVRGRGVDSAARGGILQDGDGVQRQQRGQHGLPAVWQLGQLDNWPAALGGGACTKRAMLASRSVADHTAAVHPAFDPQH